jgi:hypothetical protein
MVDLQRDYIDLSKVFGEINSYSDFEGFANSQDVTDRISQLEMVSRLQGSEDATINATVKTLTIHWLYENLDVDDLPSVHQTRMFIDNLYWLMTSRWYMKETAE